MQKMTITQFVELIKTTKIYSSHDFTETVYPHRDDTDAPAQDCGYIWNELIADGIEITYQNMYMHPQGKPSRATLQSPDNGDLQIDKMQITIFDCDGDEIDRDQLCEIITENTDIENLNMGVLGEDEFEEIDNDEETDMDTITVQRDNDLDIKFTGERIAAVSSSDNNARSDFSGNTGRWADLALYRTQGGKLICEQIGHTRWQGEHTRHSGAVCETEAQVIEFFGTGWLSKKLYDDADIDAAVEIE